MIDFLTTIWSDRSAPYVEIRTIKDGSVRANFFQPAAIEDMLEMQALIAARDRDGWDVYFGVLPRTHRPSEPGRAGTAEITADQATVLWLDIDAKSMGEGLTAAQQKQEAWWRLSAFEITPSIIVDSGHGYHAYWLLDRFMEWRSAEATMRAIAEEVGGDRVYDRPRILRVPGTHNHKDDPPTPVRLVRFDTTRIVRPGTFADWRDRGLELMEPPRPDATAFDGERIATEGRKSSLPDWLEDKIATSGGKGNRSEHAFSTILWLLRHGWDDDAIFEVFISNPEGVGEKFYEKGGMGHIRGIRWLQGSINAAKRIA